MPGAKEKLNVPSAAEVACAPPGVTVTVAPLSVMLWSDAFAALYAYTSPLSVPVAATGLMSIEPQMVLPAVTVRESDVEL